MTDADPPPAASGGPKSPIIHGATGDRIFVEDGAGSFDAYFEYNRVLRTWFVAFGVGGPALFLVNGGLAEKLAQSGDSRLVGSLFAIGVAAQVGGALLNKIANWYVWFGIDNPDFAGSCRQKFAGWVIEQFWIDILIDLITIISFGIAAWMLLTVFSG